MPLQKRGWHLLDDGGRQRPIVPDRVRVGAHAAHRHPEVVTRPDDLVVLTAGIDAEYPGGIADLDHGGGCDVLAGSPEDFGVIVETAHDSRRGDGEQVTARHAVVGFPPHISAFDVQGSAAGERPIGVGKLV